ncbi:MAG TPA: ABC transporter permease [Symbiobacteriaceae bacterium]|nr:ABC transporter permease [Symbiobacteriaceae bacterium]
MGRYLLRRLLGFLPVLLGITLISFAITELAPGDPVLLYMDRASNPTREDIEAKRHELGLDKPMPVRYVQWVGRAVTGDLGRSFVDRRPVSVKIKEMIPYSLTLAALSILVGYSLAVLVGVTAATREGTALDWLLSTMSAMLVSAPSFWIALMAILLFAVKWGLLPTSGWGEGSLWTTAHHLILPVAILSMGPVAGLSRFVRSGLLEVLRHDYVRTARAKGLADQIVLYKHALRNALIPVVTIIGLSLPGLISGAVLTENVFALPGMGRLAVGAVGARDYPTIMGVTLVLSVLTVFGNLLADLAYGLVDPRIRYN